MHPPDPIAFIKLGDFSHINESVLQQLRLQFPRSEIEVIDIFTDLISRRYALNWFHCLKEYRTDVLFGRRHLGAALLRTPYVFHKAKRAIADRLSHRRYAFTFQTQSLFDVSVPGTPHFVYTDHTHLASLRYPDFERRELYAPAWMECEKTVYRNAACTFTMSTNIARSLIEDYDCRPDQVACVYCGANVQAARDEVFDERRYAHKNILFVGVNWERKGGPVLEEAFRILLGTHPDATLTVVGCSPTLSLPNCEVVGRVPLAEVKAYFERASLFCLPTRREPFGVVFLEAMAHKLPIVATNVGAIPDFVSDGATGYLVEPNNPRKLAGKLMELIGSSERCRAFGALGHQRFWERYTWGQTGSRLREHIAPIIGLPCEEKHHE